MRLALLTSPFVVASLVFSCSTFSDADDAPPPTNDAGADAGDGGAAACAPVVVDPNAPPECAADLMSDPQNCGACGHACIDTACRLGYCEASQISGPLAAFAVEGKTLYAFVAPDVVRGDLGASPVVLEPFFSGVFGEVRRMEVHAGELYLSTTQVQSIVRIADKTQRENEHWARVATANANGLFFPGATAYYLYDGATAGQELARIDTGTGSVRYRDANSFLPIARSGNEIYWTESLAGGAYIRGPWDAPDDGEPIARLGTGLESFAVDGEDAYFAVGGFVQRAVRGTLTQLARESGTGVAFAVRGDDLYYAVRRETPTDIRHALLRVDKCRGGRPVPVFDINAAIRSVFFIDDTHVMVGTDSGIFRARR